MTDISHYLDCNATHTLEALYRDIKTTLKRIPDISSEQIDAETRLLIESTLGISPNERFTNPLLVVDQSRIATINTLLQKRIEKRTPIQYLLGKTHCLDLEFEVTPDVLIPRPETELLIHCALEHCELKANNNPEKPLHVLDLGTGSGLIAIALKKLVQDKDIKNAQVIAVDISKAALEVAKRNALKHQTEVTFIEGNLYEALTLHGITEPFDIIVSNPPYIGEDEKAAMMPEVLEHEPHLALFAPKEDRTAFYRRIAEGCSQWLAPGGVVLLELGQGLAKPATDIFKNHGFEKIQIYKDDAGIPRVFEAYKPTENNP